MGIAVAQPACAACDDSGSLAVSIALLSLLGGYALLTRTVFAPYATPLAPARRPSPSPSCSPSCGARCPTTTVPANRTYSRPSDPPRG